MEAKNMKVDTFAGRQIDGGEGIDKLWYVVYTRPRWEKKVAELLTTVGIENYCPLNKVTRQWSDREKIILEPFFKSYVFVCVSECRKWDVMKFPGVVNYVHWLGKPAVVPKAEIELVKSFLDTHDKVYLRRLNIEAGQKIKITKGVFLNLEGSVVALKGKKVQIEIPSLGLALVALDRANVALVLT
jgi:transcription antitermination factor NusG